MNITFGIEDDLKNPACKLEKIIDMTTEQVFNK